MKQKFYRIKLIVNGLDHSHINLKMFFTFFQIKFIKLSLFIFKEINSF